jgi:hypothetical protein
MTSFYPADSAMQQYADFSFYKKALWTRFRDLPFAGRSGTINCHGHGQRAGGAELPYMPPLQGYLGTGLSPILPVVRHQEPELPLR